MKENKSKCNNCEFEWIGINHNECPQCSSDDVLIIQSIGNSKKKYSILLPTLLSIAFCIVIYVIYNSIVLIPVVYSDTNGVFFEQYESSEIVFAAYTEDRLWNANWEFPDFDNKVKKAGYDLSNENNNEHIKFWLDGKSRDIKYVRNEYSDSLIEFQLGDAVYVVKSQLTSDVELANRLQNAKDAAAAKIAENDARKRQEKAQKVAKEEDARKSQEKAVSGKCGEDIFHGGYAYSTVQIGGQCWFAENCRYLPRVSQSKKWSNDYRVYYVYNYEGTNVKAAKSTDEYQKYGVLYNWRAVMTEGICPSGWHIPSNIEFTELSNNLGEFTSQGRAWHSSIYGFVDEISNGHRYSNGFAYSSGINFWSTTSNTENTSWLGQLTPDNFQRKSLNTECGFYARCLRD
jgi:uncharacterized protein (TIGR02145 family)